jgi:hypothetical protein
MQSLAHGHGQGVLFDDYGVLITGSLFSHKNTTVCVL